MRCNNCGHELPPDTLYCQYCGEELRIVPDYNPLEDMLAAQIKSSINNQNRSIKNSSHNNTVPRRNVKATKDERELREARRKQAERRREIKKRKRRRLLLIMAIFIGFVIGIGILLYQTSYTGIINKAEKAFSTSEYNLSKEYYEKAIAKDPEHSKAYVGLSKIYIAKKDLVRAEKLFLEAIEKYPDNTDIYEACIQFYLETNQSLEIPQLIDTATDHIKDTLSKYIVKTPEFSLEAGIVYDDVQQLSLESKYTVYYTVNGSNPSLTSMKYKEPIQLDEGETVIKAIAVNKSGVPSLPVEKVYMIQLPIEDAPAVSPSTGQYDNETQIEIKVPDGYTAYYTVDGSTPTTASTKYYGPIDMPEHNTLFKAILVNSAGRSSGVTTRNYILELSDE